MPTETQAASISEVGTVSASKKMIWAGRIMSGLVVLFLLFDGVVKLLRLPIAMEPTVRLGYPESLVLAIGIVELVCTVAYAIPRTSIFGAILLTGYLGGATATHVRVGDPFFFPIVIGVLVWAGLYLRDERLRELNIGLLPRGQAAPVSKKMLWTGRVLSALPALLLLFSGTMKLAGPPEVAQEFTRLGYPDGVGFGVGMLEILCTVIYFIPRTSILGAMLLAGYLGGATATHLRVGDPFNAFFMPAVIGAVLWAGLYLRDARLRALIPVRR